MPSAPATQAQRADKYALYEKTVQDPEHEVAFLGRVYRSFFKRAPKRLREDFCGTFRVCCEWVNKRGREAVGVDLDPEPLDWGRQSHLAGLPLHQQRRIQLIQADVREKGGGAVDVVAAQNFSFWTFKTREELRAYFEAARANLADQGVFVLDMMGGPESMEEDREEVRDHGRFQYVWEQARLDPITHHGTWHIHFRFRDGSKMEKAFTYHWRFWTIPETRELLEEAGFDEVAVYWEGTTAEGEGDGTWRRRRWAPADPAWIAYVVGVKRSPAAGR